MQYGIFDYRGRVGELTLQHRGLYETIIGTLPDPGLLLRLWLVGRNETLLLGTAVPEQDRLLCRRTLSRRQIPEGILGAVAVPLQAVWQRDGNYMYRITPQGAALAEGYTQAEPVEQIAYYATLQPEQIDGATWLVRRISLWEYVQQCIEKERGL